MATSVDSVHKSSDLFKDYSCEACESKNFETSADFFCETCLKCFCQKCLFHHDQIFVKHLTYGRGETHKWPLANKMEDLLMKCDIHNNEKLKMFCQDHSQLCCSDCVLLNHRQCTDLALISESVKKLSVDMQQLSNKIQTILAELNKCEKTQEANIQSLERSYTEKQQEIREQRKKLNAALDALENATLKELDEIRTTLQTSMKKDVDNCSRLKDELQQLCEAVQGLHDKGKKEMEFIASRKCLDKIQVSESYLKEKPAKVQSSITFKAFNKIEQYLSKQSSLGRIVHSMLSLPLEMNPDKVLTVKKMSQYNLKISNDTSQIKITGICSLPSGQVIVAEMLNQRVMMLDEYYHVSSQCNVDGIPEEICQITPCEVAVICIFQFDVQFISVTNRQLVNGRTLKLRHPIKGIAHHQEKLYITTGTSLFHYTLTGTLVKKLYDTEKTGCTTVNKCAVSPAGDKIYVTNCAQHKLITLAKDGTLISVFTDHELQSPRSVHVTPSGQVLVCGLNSDTVIQVDCEGKNKLATLASKKDGLSKILSVYYNTITNQIIVPVNDFIIVMDLQ